MRKIISFILTIAFIMSVGIVSVDAVGKNPYVRISSREPDATNNWDLVKSTSDSVKIMETCWLQYDNLDFTGKSNSLTMSLAWDAWNMCSIVYIRLGGPTGEKIATLDLTKMEGPGYSFREVEVKLDRAISGVQTICFTGAKMAYTGVAFSNFVFHEMEEQAIEIADIDGIQQEDDINFAIAANLMSVNEEFMFRPEDYLTRGELAVALAGAVTGAQEPVTVEEAIDLVCDQGYMQPYPDGKFRENDKVRYNESVAGIFKLLGYNEQAGFKSDDDYIKISSKLIKGTKASGEYITRANMATMLDNAMDIPFINWLKVNGELNYTYEKEHTLRNDVIHIFEKVGIVEASQGCSLQESALIENEADVIISSNKYATEISFDKYIGKKMRIFYKDNGKTDFPQIISFRILDEDMNIVEIASKNIKKIQDRTYYYYDPEDDKNKTIKFDNYVPVVYNGRAYDLYKEADLKPEVGFVQLIDNDGDEVADVIIVEAYETVVVSAFDTLSGAIYDKFSGNVIYIDETKNDFEITKNGKKVFMDEVSLRNLNLWVRTSKNTKGKVKQIIQIATEYAEGKATLPSISGSNMTIEMNENTYFISPRYAENYSKNKLIKGFEYMFYFDPEGNIMNAEPITEDDYLLGIVVKTYTGDAGMNKLGQARVYNEKNEMLVLDFAEKIKVDGEYYTDYEKAIEAIENGYQSGPVVKYGTDKEGKLRYIDTPYVNPETESDESLRYIASGANLYRSETGIVGAGVAVDGDTKVFRVPKNSAGELSQDEKDYHVYGSGYFSNDVYYSVTSYSSSFKRAVDAADAVCINVSAGSSSASSIGYINSSSMIVTGVYGGVNEKDEEISIVKGLCSGKEQTFEVVFEEFDELNVTKGDFLMFETDSQNRISCAVKYFNKGLVDGNGAMISSSNTWFRNENEGVMSDCLIYIGRVNDFGDKFMQIAQGNADGGYIVNSNANIYLYDFLTGECEVGRIDDVIKGDPVVARLRHAKLQVLVVLKNYNWE